VGKKGVTGKGQVGREGRQGGGQEGKGEGSEGKAENLAPRSFPKVGAYGVAYLISVLGCLENGCDAKISGGLIV